MADSDHPISYEQAAGHAQSDSASVPYDEAAGGGAEDTTGTALPWSDLPSNLLPSAGQFVGNLTYPFMHPKDFAEGIGKVITDPDARKAVGQFYKDRYGGWENIRNTMIRDPVGITADLAGVLSGGELTAERAAVGLGKLGATRAAAGAQTVANGLRMSGSAIDPVANTGRLMGATKDAAGSLYTNVLGLTTLKGADVFSDAARAGWEGSKTFLDNLNKKVPVEGLVSTLEDAVERVKSHAENYYRANFPKLAKPIDTSPIHDAWSQITNSPKLLETPVSQEEGAWKALAGDTSGHADYQVAPRGANSVTDFTTESGLTKGSQNFADQMQGIKDLVDKYTTKPETLWVENAKAAPIALSDGSTMQPGNWVNVNVPKPRSVYDLDALKQALGDLQQETTNPRIQSIAGRMRDSVKGIIEDAHPEYASTMEQYAHAKALLTDIRQTFAIGKDRAGINTKLGKIGKIYSENAAGERSGELLNQLEDASGQPLRAAIAGQRLSSWTPLENSPAKMIVEGLAAKEGFAALGAKLVPLLGLASPKLMGLATYGANRAASIFPKVYNKLHGPSPRHVGQAAVQLARPSELANDPDEISIIRAEQAAGVQ